MAPNTTTDHHIKLYNQLKADQFSRLNAHHCVIAGAGETGKSTFVKQLEMIHSGRYSEDNERTPFIVDIRRSICRQMCSLARKVRGSVHLLSTKHKKDEIERLTSPTNHPFLHLKSEEGEKIIHRPYRNDVERVWSGIEAEHELRIRQYQMTNNLRYFVGTRFDNVCNDEYIPTKMDVLRTRLPTSTVREHRIVVNGTGLMSKLMNKTKRFVFFDVGGQKRHRKEWASLLHDMKYVVFFASLAEYNEKLEEDGKTNRLVESIALFQQIVREMQKKGNSDKSYILMLNKEDLFDDKFIDGQIKLSDYFPDYIGSEIDADEAKQFIKGLFLKGIEHEQIFTRFTTAIDENNIRSVFDDIMHHHFFTT